MRTGRLAVAAAGIWILTCRYTQAQAQKDAPLPDVRQLMREVVEHQKHLDKIRENYTYNSSQVTEDLDAAGKVTKNESTDNEDFFVNGHVIERKVKKDGQPLSQHEEEKESERIQKLVERAQNTPADQPLEGQTVSISRLLEIMNVSAARREVYRKRPAIVFDFTGRKDAKTHGLMEDASKKLEGTILIDEADRQVAHLEVTFTDDFHVAGGLLANIRKGTNFRFDQEPVADGLWLPTGSEAMLQARVLLLKNMRQHFREKVYNYKRFTVETEQGKDEKVKKDQEAGKRE